MRQTFRSVLAASLTGALFAAGLAVLPARADEAPAPGQTNQSGTPSDAEATARAQSGCGFEVEVHFTDGRTENARWEMAPGNSPIATAFCRSRGDA